MKQTAVDCLFEKPVIWIVGEVGYHATLSR